MIFDRKSVRLKDWDYSKRACYFVTMCIDKRNSILMADVDNGLLVLNDFGKMVSRSWIDSKEDFNISLGNFVLMPDHFHGIVWMKRKMDRAAIKAARTDIANADIANTEGAGFMPAQIKATHTGIAHKNITLGNIIGAFKSKTTGLYIKGVKEFGWPKFEKRVWQRNYYESIIKNRIDYIKVVSYIRNNPKKYINGA